jgi:hypothetical protein
MTAWEDQTDAARKNVARATLALTTDPSTVALDFVASKDRAELQSPWNL